MSRDFFHSTIVPPNALFLDIGISWSFLSSEFSSEQNSPLKKDMQYGRSEEKICGSLRKIKSGSAMLMKFLRLNRFLLRPSKFHVSDFIVQVEGVVVEVEVSGVLEGDDAPTVKVSLSETSS